MNPPSCRKITTMVFDHTHVPRVNHFTDIAEHFIYNSFLKDYIQIRLSLGLGATVGQIILKHVLKIL